MNAALAAFVAGLIFAVGLALGGMTLPGKVTAFLDIFGNWDPSLALVMLGAITVHAVLYRVIRRHSSPLFAPTFSTPTRRDLDFPGPAITSLASGQPSTLIFVAAMLVGMFLYKLVDKAWGQPLAIPPQQEPHFVASTTSAFEGPQDA